MTSAKIGFGISLSSTDQLSHEEFLQQVDWAKSASKSLTRASDVATFCTALRKHALGAPHRGGSKKATSKTVQEKSSLWSKYAFDSSGSVSPLVGFWESFGVKPRRSVAGRKTSTTSRRNGSAGKKADPARLLKILSTEESLEPVDLLIVFEILHRVGTELPDDVLFAVWRKALVSAISLSTHFNEPAGNPAPEDQRLLILGELPLQAGLLFADVKGGSSVCKLGSQFLRTELLDQTDTDGTPNAELLERLSLWIACLVRATEWTHAFRFKLWSAETRGRFRDLVGIVAPFCRLDGKLALGNGSSHQVPSLMTSAYRVAGWKDKTAPADLVRDVKRFSEKPKKSKRTNKVRRRLRDNDDYPVTQSDWARVACMRSDWSPHSDTLIVAHHATEPMIDLAVLGDVLLSGAWDLSVSINGKPVELDDDWDCNCWYSDEDADYLELNQTLDNGVMIDRQLMLSRENHFAVFADCISGAKDARIEYASRLPLVKNAAAKQSKLSRECTLKVEGTRVRAFPLALPDDRVIGTPGQFGVSDGRLELKQVAIGGLYAPVVLDWDPKLSNKGADWRTLTVSHDGKMLKTDMAAGHRLRIGEQQVFFYRRIDESEEPHSVLGHHTMSETVIGMFDEIGEVDPIVIVE